MKERKDESRWESGMQVGKEGTWEAEEKKFFLFWVLRKAA